MHEQLGARRFRSRATGLLRAAVERSARSSTGGGHPSLQGLRATAEQLAAGERLEVVLAAIAERVARAGPGGCLITVEGVPGGPSTVYLSGLTQQRAADLAVDVDERRAAPPGSVAVQIRAGKRVYGQLLLLDAPPPGAAEHDLLAAYAAKAAAALSRHEALEQARLASGRAGVLGSLSRSLAGTQDPHEVTRLLVEALPATMGCDSAAVWLWDAGLGEIRAVAVTGLADELAELLLDMPVRAADTPELTEMLARREPLVLHVDEVTPVLASLMTGLRLSTALGVPLVGGAQLLGAATASYESPLRGPALSEAVARLQGVADRASSALQNAYLVEEVRRQSMHDPLTGLANRVLFQDRLDQALHVAEREGGVAVLFCDLDRFKQINDSLGHAAGDEVLRQVATRLSAAVRPGDTVGRLSGDEFAALLPGLEESSTALQVAQRLVECFEQPLRVAGRQLSVTVSVGIGVHFGPDGVSGDLLGSADAAMYSAKRLGRNQIASAASGPCATGQGRAPVGQLRDGIVAGELRMVLQPVMRLTSSADESDTIHCVGAEALVRWVHPTLGVLSPAAFVPRAEEDGSIVELDLWMLRQACHEAAGWQSPPGRELHIAVNLSVRTLGHPDLPELVRTALLDSGLEPHRLYLEVVETRAMLDLPRVVERLTAMRHLGVRIALDDFGTGFSTLSWLLNLPVDLIKIDRSFVIACAQVADLRRQVTARALLEGFVSVGAELDVAVVAEGVETRAQLDAVTALGCPLVQGNLLCRPVQAREFRDQFALPAQGESS